MSAGSGHLAPFLKVLHGPLKPDGSFDGHPGRERYVAIHHSEGMYVPVGEELRGEWLVPADLAGPAQPPHPHGLLAVLRQPDEPERLRGDGGVAVQSLREEQFLHVDRVESSGKLVFNLAGNLKM